MMVFDGRFAATRELHPFDHWQCDAPGAAYLRGNGKTVAPLPGKERGYAAEVEQLAKLDPTLVITPPA